METPAPTHPATTPPAAPYAAGTPDTLRLGHIVVAAQHVTDDTDTTLELHRGPGRSSMLVKLNHMGSRTTLTLDPNQLGALRAFLCDDPITEDGEGDNDPKRSTIAEDAQRMQYGDREDDYGHPRESFTRHAILWTGLLHHLLADGEHITPEDVGRCLLAMKLSRDVHDTKRDNRVDMAGYAIALDRLATGH